jgi:hypothetical protein
VTRALIIVVAAALALSGCASLAEPPVTTSTPIASVTNNEVPTPPPPAQQPVPGSAAPTAAQAVRTFAMAYINWTAGTVKRVLLALAARSVGQARSAMALAAAQTGGDYELHQGGVANSGTVEAVAPLPGRSGEYVVVTREQTSAANSNAYAGLQPAWHVTVATVRRLPSGSWVVSGWQPQS